MKMIVTVALALVAVASALPVEEPIPIVRSDVQHQPDGAYQYSFETGNGIVRSENGELRQTNDEDNKPVTVLVVRGQYSYPGEDGKPVEISYTADEFGFHPEGESIPKPASRR